MTMIEKKDALLAELEQLGLESKKRHEPEAGALAGRYSYDPETGDIVGPSGKSLKPHPNRGVFRVGLWHDGRSVRVITGRLAFALQHGRWPVGVHYLNGDTSDNSAANVVECRSLALKAAKPKPIAAPAAVLVPVVLVDQRAVDPRNYRGANWGGKNVFDEMRMIRRVLNSSKLLPWQRRKLEAVLVRLDRIADRLCRVAASAAGSSVAGAAPSSPSVSKHRAGVRPKGPSLAQKKAGGLVPPRSKKSGRCR